MFQKQETESILQIKDSISSTKNFSIKKKTEQTKERNKKKLNSTRMNAKCLINFEL